MTEPQASGPEEGRYYSGRRLRGNLLSFGVGKVLNAGVAFFNFVLIARALSVGEYAAYSVLWSAIFLSIFVSSIGLGAVALDQLPKFQEFAIARLPRLILALLGVRLASLLVTAIVLALLAGPLLDRASIAVTGSEVRLAVPLMVAYGTLIFYQACIFVPLYRQLSAQFATLSRTCLLSGFILFALAGGGRLTLEDVLRLDLIAVGLSLGLCAILTVPLLRRRSGAGRPGWRPGGLALLARLALHDHLSYLMKLSASSYAVMLVAAHLLDPASLASLGFVLALTEQIRANLPAELLWRVVHPRLTMEFQVGRSFEALNRYGVLLYKASLAVLGPGLVIVAAYGPELMGFLSGGKFSASWPVMLLMLLTLIPWSHSIVLWGVALIVGRPDTMTKGAVWALATIPLMLAAGFAGFGNYGIVAAIAVTVVAQNFTMVAALRRAGYPYAVDLGMMLRFLAAVAIAMAILGLVLAHAGPAGLPMIVAVCAAAAALFFALGLVTRFASRSDARLVGRMLSG